VGDSCQTENGSLLRRPQDYRYPRFCLEAKQLLRLAAHELVQVLEHLSALIRGTAKELRDGRGHDLLPDVALLVGIFIESSHELVGQEV
jgi:hypothetical protein